MLQNIVAVTLLLMFTAMVTDSRVITFPRCDKTANILQFVYSTSDLEPSDVYATNRRSTCSLSAGIVSGSGSFTDPYILTVDLSEGLANQKPDCGVEKIGPNLYRLQVVVIFAGGSAQANNTEFSAECSLNLSSIQASRNASYTCQAPSTILFSYSQSDTSPFDIYAVGHRGTCSKSANFGRGSGVSGDAYVLTIDVHSSEQNCGIKTVNDDVYESTILVQQTYPLVTGDDVIYKLTCNYSSEAMETMTSTQVRVKGSTLSDPATRLTPSALLFLTTLGGDAVTEVFVGEEVRLTAKLTDTVATGLRLTNCIARAGRDTEPIVSLTMPDGCPSGLHLISPFTGLLPDGAVAQTSVFPAFRFADHDTLLFECKVKFCYSGNDSNCVGNHCSTSRQKRDTVVPANGEVISAFVTIHGVKNLQGKSGCNFPRTSSWTAEVIATVMSLAGCFIAAVCVSFILCLFLVRRGRKGQRLWSHELGHPDKNQARASTGHQHG